MIYLKNEYYCNNIYYGEKNESKYYKKYKEKFIPKYG